ncbi:Trp biosynthesis-associated membrane protein [Microbacterium sp. C7(2022)]|uniref:Trp biosynthesis-associated membrane protein n=1 Tax=Microbacterium sp. C7(2022) TaxID=2992759 RepID=UPI00237AAC01|nr:Trp biosynthesis-associated membrane protein [Microbacterium sp. C7(2022)]MDE0545566.1 Trp biosynthesis-associated membrane protein [Microbacterium sp. C7(2022)]
MIRRARTLSVSLIVLCGALGVISSTQTWLHVALVDGGSSDLAVAGATAVPVLAPLSLAVLASGLALSIMGMVLRHVFAAMTVLIAIALVWVTAVVVLAIPISAIAATVTEATGIAGEQSVRALVAGVQTTAWPVITLVTSIVLAASGLFALWTARRWGSSGRRYQTEPATAASGVHTPHPPATSSTSDAAPGNPKATPPAGAPRDAIDSWDDLSRGEDPTA